MAGVSVLAHALALTAAATAAGADSCSERFGPGSEMKPLDRPMYCSTGDFSRCQGCCQQLGLLGTNTCANPPKTFSKHSRHRSASCSLSSTKKNTDYYKDPAKGATTWWGSNSYQSVCCTRKKTCDIECDNTKGFFARPADGTLCAGATCRQAECCASPLPACYAACGTNVCTDSSCCGVAAAAKAAGKYCDSDSVLGRKTAAATVDTFKANCCKGRHCDTYTCPAGYTDKANKASIRCDATDEDQCYYPQCCDIIPDTCRGHRVAKSRKCDSSFGLMYNIGAEGAAVKTDSSDFNAVCCSPLATCADFAATASAAEGQQVAAMTLVLAVGALLSKT